MSCTYCGQTAPTATPCTECPRPAGGLRVVGVDPAAGQITVGPKPGEEPSYVGAEPPRWVCHHAKFEVNASLTAYTCRGCGVVVTTEDVEAHRGRNSCGLPEDDGTAIRRAFSAASAAHKSCSTLASGYALSSSPSSPLPATPAGKVALVAELARTTDADGNPCTPLLSAEDARAMLERPATDAAGIAHPVGVPVDDAWKAFRDAVRQAATNAAPLGCQLAAVHVNPKFAAHVGAKDNDIVAGIRVRVDVGCPDDRIVPEYAPGLSDDDYRGGLDFLRSDS